MKLRPLACLLMVFHASLCCAQTKVLVIEGQPKEDVEKSYQLVPSVTGTNAAKFNSRIAAARHPAFFPEGQWRMEKTAVVPAITGLKISGGGQDRPMAEGQWGGTGWGGPTPRITYTGPRISFNGTTVTAANTSASATIKLTGWDVTDDDVGMVLNIIGGTNFITYDIDPDPDPMNDNQQGWYVVQSVDPVADTWTLNRVCTTAPGPATLLNNLVSYWKLDEATGDALDAHGTNDLTDTNMVGAAAGKLGGARDLEGNDDEYFSHADNADLSTGDIDFTFAGWVWLESKTGPGAPGGRVIASKRDSTSVAEWLLWYGAAGDRFGFKVYDSTGAEIGSVNANNLGAVSTGVWYYIVAWHNADANTVNIQVNDGEVDSQPTTGVPSDTAATFRLGSSDTSPFNQFDGRLDECGFWKRPLLPEERTALYNDDAGTPYEAFYGAGSGMTGFASHTLWRDEGVGTLYEGLAFRGHPTWQSSPKCMVGWHQVSNVASGQNLNTGKATFRNCTFSDFRVGMLFGRNMDRAYMRRADFDSNPQDYAGEFDNHGDHPSTQKMKFVANDTCLLVRNRHSVNHRHVDWHCTDCNEIFYFERGGQLFADQIELNHGTVLRLGVTNHNHNLFVIRNVTVDGQAQEFKMLKMDQDNRESNQTIIFDGGIIDGEVDAGDYDGNLPLWHAKSGTKLVIRNFRRLRPNCIEIDQTPGGEIPHVVVENCMLEGCTNQHDIIDEENSTPGAQITFSGNSNFDNTIVWEPEHYPIPTP